jgi:RimJ/RimL family protein N-acetyltransferase
VVTNEAPQITTERLLLREWREEDKVPFAALNADPTVTEFFPSSLTRAESDAMIERMSEILAEKGRGLWATEVKATHEFIGFIGLSMPGFETSFTPCVEIGWRLGKTAWGHGYATEGARAALAFAFEHVELPNDEVVSFTTELNVRSRRVMDKIGLTHDPARDFDHPKYPDWWGCRHVLYAMTRSQWQRAKP